MNGMELLDDSKPSERAVHPELEAYANSIAIRARLDEAHRDHAVTRRRLEAVSNQLAAMSHGRDWWQRRAEWRAEALYHAERSLMVNNRVWIVCSTIGAIAMLIAGMAIRAAFHG